MLASPSNVVQPHWAFRGLIDWWCLFVVCLFLPWFIDCSNLLQVVLYAISTCHILHSYPRQKNIYTVYIWIFFFTSVPVWNTAINKSGRLCNKHPLTHITLFRFLQTLSYFFDVSCLDGFSFRMSLQVSLLDRLNSLFLSLLSPNNPLLWTSPLIRVNSQGTVPMSILDYSTSVMQWSI